MKKSKRPGCSCADSGKVIGNIYCGARDFAAKEVGYIINKAYQRQGYAGEALSKR